MRNVSNKFYNTLQERTDFYPVAEITFLDGTKKVLSKGDDFAVSGNSVIESAESSSFPLGVFAAKRINISLINDDDRWSYYDFYGAKIFLQTKFDLDDGTTETLNIGTFTVVTPENYGTTVVITAIDESYKADVDYSTTLPYPASAGVALKDSCDTCGIVLGTLTFANDDFVIQEMPVDLTHRQFIGMIAMIAGGNAVMDEHNRLMIKSYDFSEFEKPGLDGGIFDAGTPRYETGDDADGGSFNPWDKGDEVDGGKFGDRDNIHMLYEFKSGITIGVDDVVITGVQITDDEKNVHLYGSDGYVLSLENQLATGKEDKVVRLIGQAIAGLRFRPFSGDHIAYPLAEFMDLAYLFDRKNNIYRTVLTDVSFNYYGFTTLKCTADSPIRNSSKYYGNETKAIVQARQMVEKEKNSRELAIEKLQETLANSSGLYPSEERQPDGSTIYYLHDKPTKAESKAVIELTREAIGISQDGGKSYPWGVTFTGEAILEKIYTVGLDADFITTGAFEIRKDDGTILALLNKDTKQVILRPDIFELSNGSTIDSIAEEKANSKSKTFLTQPVPPYRVGDLWYGGDDKDVLVCKNTRLSGNYQSSDWGKADRYIDQAAANTAASDAVAGISQTDVLNKLTNDGKDKGIYLQNDQLYISFSAARGGELTLGGTDNLYGKLKLLNSSGGDMGYLDNTGFSIASSKIVDSLVNRGRVTIYGANMEIYGVHGSANTEHRVLSFTPIAYVYGDNSGYGADIKTNNTGIIKISAEDSYSRYYEFCGNADEDTTHDFRGGASFKDWVTIHGNLTAKNTNSIAQTTSYGQRLLSTPGATTPTTSDVGGGRTDENGECVVFLDPVFLESIEQNVEYRVFLQKEGEGDIWIEEKASSYFFVRGTPNLKFSWEVKAVQLGGEITYMEEMDNGYSSEDDTETDVARINYIEEYKKLVQEEEESWQKY